VRGKEATTLLNGPSGDRERAIALSGDFSRADEGSSMTKKTQTKPKEETLTIDKPEDGVGRLKRIGGSRDDSFNNVLANQVVNALWLDRTNDGYQEKQKLAAISALMGIGPKDEIEGMLAAQMVAIHSASMECLRRAMIPEQTFQGRTEALNQANKLSRTFTAQMEALQRYRGKGQQKVTVEHVHVHSGGQAIVGAVTGGTGVHSETEKQPDAKQVTHAPEPAMRGQIAEREPVPVASGKP
jgi:hypothetical protein